MPKTGKVCVFYYSILFYSILFYYAIRRNCMQQQQLMKVPFTAHSPKAKRRANMINKNGFKPYTSTTND